MTQDEICRNLRERADALRAMAVQRGAEQIVLESEAAGLDAIADALGCPPRAAAAGNGSPAPA